MGRRGFQICDYSGERSAVGAGQVQPQAAAADTCSQIGRRGVLVVAVAVWRSGGIHGVATPTPGTESRLISRAVYDENADSEASTPVPPLPRPIASAHVGRPQVARSTPANETRTGQR